MNKKYCVYMHVSPDRGCYIGKTSRKPIVRWTEGTRYTRNKDFFNDILRYGGEDQFLKAFAHYILSPDGSWFEWKNGMAIKETNFFTQEEAAELEKKWIAHYKRLDSEKVYNRSSGGDHSFQYDDIAKDRNREAHVGLYDGEKNPFYGKKHSEEMKKHFSELAKQRTGEKNPFHGKQHTEEAKAKNRQSHLGLYDGEKNPFYGKQHTTETKEKISQENSRPISMYSLRGQFIQTFPSVTAAAETMGVAIQSISMCATKATKTCCHRIWRYYECEQIPPYDMPGKHGICKPILQYDLNGNYLKTFESIKEAAESCNTTPTAIVQAAKKRNRQAGGYVWRYFKCEQIPFDELPIRYEKCRSVSQYDLQGNYIKTFKSIKEAAKSVGVTPEAIVCAAKGRTKQSGGYKWEYSQD